MLLAQLVDVSTQVASTRSRLAKRELIADLLREVAGAGGEEIDVAASYLSGTLRQRRTGLGWRSLADLPEPATEPSVGLVEVDATLEEISALSGAGSMGVAPRGGDHPVRPPDRGRAGVPAQPGHRQRPSGRTRLGDARRHRGRGRARPQVRTPRGHVQRADRTHRPRSADRGRRRARGLQPARRPAGPADARRHRSRRRCRCRQGRGTVRRRHQAGRHPDPGAQARRRGGGVHAQPRGDRCPAPRGRRRPPGRCRPPT